MERCFDLGSNVCIDRYTPCGGRCWHESNNRLCGNNLCLSSFQTMVKASADPLNRRDSRKRYFFFFHCSQDHHVCNGTCYDFSVPCGGRCQSKDFYMCSSGDQCYRYWDNCDGVAQCADASDESVTCQVWPIIIWKFAFWTIQLPLLWEDTIVLFRSF